MRGKGRRRKEEGRKDKGDRSVEGRGAATD